MIERRRDGLPASSTPQVAPPATLVLPGEFESARAARDFARNFLASRVPNACEVYVDWVVLVTCELATNSIRYGTEPGDSLAVTLDANPVRTRIEVRDPVRRRPRRKPLSTERDRGRGLLILDAICPDAWGVEDRPFGKAVWAQVTAP